MAEVINMPVDSLDHRQEGKDNKPPAAADEDSDSPPPPPPPAKRRDRDSRERRDDGDSDRRRASGDYYDRNRSPPPPTLRERDYKRRASPSPPPPYRDRRPRSPQHPPFKRSRRDDAGYDGRRGSPRGGYGSSDRRFGYDYPYDREVGGRPGYADEKPHGRYIGRTSGGYPSGPFNWDSGLGSYNEASSAGGSHREGLMSYKQFIQELEDDILPAEAERRYQEYKSEYISTQKRAFFNAHKDEEWLKDKYHPTNLLGVIERRNELARKMAKDFLLDLQSGTLDLGPGVNTLSLNKSGQTSDPNSEDEADVSGKRRRHEKAPSKESDVLSAAPRAHHVSSEPRRIQIDIEQAQALVRKLDFEKGIEDNVISRVDNDRTNRDKSHTTSSGPVIIVRGLTSVKGLEGIELLDTLLTYLWRIHGVDYYGLVETSEPKGLRHVRIDGKGSGGPSDGTDWEKKLDSRWQERLKCQDPLEVMTAKEKIDAATAEALDPHVRKIRDEKYGWKYGCGAKGCTKLFHAAEFVHKHLKLKHPDLVMELTSKVREDLYFQNYMDDADSPGSAPVMRPSVLKEKPQRHRPALDNRLKDERGSRRERDNRDTYDRSEKQQSLDFQTNDDVPVGTNPDELMFDSFGGQGIHVAPPFPSDIHPPPVLMPVLGAGPLGPFVPAPPEVAMQMMRDQGGPSPFEGSGRNGRPGAAPIIALPPTFRQNPRRLRSYQDLDAPEDEVTVIDYRSL
ncbi:serrate RNA effector molecule-like isoform X4 [Diospyros lotus]|uniref:serrate RNA effector molecule-like isoform X4 n=1 Tax=Diospyros lotus TaxID=55363 RepID=UPI0022590A95|nr:serrate RNA effector molecule-like isoform X4 [Diospyros lotus]